MVSQPNRLDEIFNAYKKYGIFGAIALVGLVYFLPLAPNILPSKKDNQQNQIVEVVQNNSVFDRRWISMSLPLV